MKHFKKFIYSLGGADYNVIQHNTFSVRVKYILKALSFCVSLPIVFFGWYDLANIFPVPIWIKIGLPLYITLSIFHLDLSLLYNDENKGNSWVRWGVAITNNILCVLFILLNLNLGNVQTFITEKNQSKLDNLDSNYLADKRIAYSHIDTIQSQRDVYHAQICVPQSLNVRVGPLYIQGHKLCEERDSIILAERSRIDSTQARFYDIYNHKRNTLSSGKSDVFNNLDILILQILPKSISKIIIGILFAFFLLCLETSPLLLHLSSNNDEYHQDLAKFKANHKLKSDQRLKTMQDHKDKRAELETKKQNDDDLNKWAEEKLESILKRAPTNYKLKEYKRIFREQGMPELSDEISDIQNTINNGSDMDKVMNHLINKLNQN